jgi:hypothetical protein
MDEDNIELVINSNVTNKEVLGSLEDKLTEKLLTSKAYSSLNLDKIKEENIRSEVRRQIVVEILKQDLNTVNDVRVDIIKIEGIKSSDIRYVRKLFKNHGFSMYYIDNDWDGGGSRNISSY